MKLDLIRTLPVEEFLLSRVALAPDGGEVAVGHKHFRTYDTATGAARAEFAFDAFLAQLSYSPDGRFLAAVNIGDNHPATRGRVGLFHAATGAAAWQADEARPVQACAFRREPPQALFWQRIGADTAELAGAGLDPYAALDPVPLPDLQVRALACTPGGFVCFGREAAGVTRSIEGAELIFRAFRLLSLGADGAVRHNFDLGIGAGVHALSPDGRLLAAEMVDFKNNERHVSLFDVETGVEANLLALEANTLPVLGFGLGSEYFLCMKEDAEGNFNRLLVWRTADLKLLGEARVELAFHSFGACLERGLVALLGGGKLDLFAFEP